MEKQFGTRVRKASNSSLKRQDTVIECGRNARKKGIRFCNLQDIQENINIVRNGEVRERKVIEEKEKEVDFWPLEFMVIKTLFQKK